MKFHLLVPVLDLKQLHGHAGLDAGHGHLARFPQNAQRAEVVKLPSLLVKSSQFQNGVAVIRNGDLKRSNQSIKYNVITH